MVALGLDMYVDFVVTSEEVGLDKPHSAMFSTALTKLNLKNEEVIMIGDDLTKDIDGARKQNIKAYLV
jgi:putative hydrolase of the HAD superfamily